jgi:hypothetical protein
MPTWERRGQTFRRKNLYMPCIINARIDEMSDEEVAELYKATYWADNITNSEWPAVLRHDDCSPSARSRLKKKAAGWIMALERIGRLNPKLIQEIAAKADEMYREQIEEEPPLDLMWADWQLDEWEELLQKVRNAEEDDDDA